MIRICAWCGKNMGAAPSDVHAETIITHGVCAACLNKLFGEEGVELQVFLDSLAVPVVVVDATVTVKTANRPARALLHKEAPDIEGYKGGDVFECAHAKQPEGCGYTIHCSGCVIRQTVTDTFRSGRSHLKVPACLQNGTPADHEQVNLLISTEKVGGVVLLRMDEVGGTLGAPP